MANKRITPIMTGVVLVPGCRYMLNVKTGVIYPYNASMMEKNENLREFFPTFRTPPSGKPEAVPEAVGGDIIEPIDIDEVIVDIPAPVVEDSDANNDPVPDAKPVAESEPVDPRIANLAKARAAKNQKKE